MEIALYADDIVFINKNAKDLDLAVKIINLWAEENEMIINTSKSGILLIMERMKRKIMRTTP